MNVGTLGLPGSGAGQSQRVQLVRQAFGDDNGLIYWLGSRGKTQQYQNPAEWRRASALPGTAGWWGVTPDTADVSAEPLLPVCASSSFFGVASILFDRLDSAPADGWSSTPNLFHTNNTGQFASNSFILFTLPQGHRFRPTELTWRSRSDSNATHPTSLSLYGFGDDAYVLDTLAAGNPGFTAAAQWRAVTATASKFYRIFMVAGSGSGYLTGSECELYGELVCPSA